MAIGRLQFNNRRSIKQLAIVLKLAGRLDMWHSHQSRVHRSVQESACWAIDQTQCEFFRSAYQLVSAVTATKSLVMVFELQRPCRLANSEEDLGTSFTEDRLATFFGEGTLGVAAFQLKRQL